MKYYLKTVWTTLTFCLLLSNSSKSQIGVSNIAEVAKIKNGTTYVVMKDPNAESAKEYIDAFKESWTISKIGFIKYSEIEAYVSPDNSFITIEGDILSTFDIIDYEKGERKAMKVFGNNHTYLDLWTCDKKYFESKKKNKKFDFYSKIDVARIELFTTQWDFRLIYNSDFDEKGLIRNWGPGILKNYIQSLMNFLNKDTNHGLYSGIKNTVELEKLKKQTLYLPNYVLTKYKANGEEIGTQNEKELFKDYKFDYQLLSTEDLNKRILNDKTSFYYLIYVQSATDKYISIINSITGEIIYSTYIPGSVSFSSEDLKNLVKKM